MAAAISCPECNRSLRLPESATGSEVCCPLCNHRFTAVQEVPPLRPVLVESGRAGPAERPRPTRSRPRDDERKADGANPPRRSSSRKEKPKANLFPRYLAVMALTPLILPAVAVPCQFVDDGAAGAVGWCVLGAMLAGLSWLVVRRRTWSVGLRFGLSGTVLLLSGFLLLGGGIYTAFQSLSKIPERAWEPFSVPKFNCRVEMPGRPVFVREGNVDAYRVSRGVPPWQFEIAANDILENGFIPGLMAPDAILDAMRDEVVHSTPEGVLVVDKPITCGSHPGRELHLRARLGSGVVRMFLVNGRRIYVLSASGIYATPEAAPVKRFFASLQILDPEEAPNAGGKVREQPVPPEARVIPGLLAYWPFDEGEGKKADDVTAAGRTGKLVGAQWIAGVLGQALQCGRGTHFDFSDAAKLDFKAGQAFTVSGWIQTDEEAGTVVSLRRKSDAGTALNIFVENGHIGAFVRQDGAAATAQPARVDGGDVDDGAWHHFALTRTGDGTIELFLDGNSMGRDKSANARGPVSTDLRALGVDPYRKLRGGDGAPFDGLIDEFCIFSRVLKVEEIKKLAGVH